MAVYIAAVSGGNCLTKHNGAILNKKPTKGANQLWTIERKEGSDSQIAIRLNDDGKYLRAIKGNAYGAVETGAKQWWELEDGPAHGSYWVKCCEFPNAYLCNANGSYIEDNKIYMWPKQTNWTHALTFYLQDANASGFKSQISSDEGDADVEKVTKDIKAREDALEKKEAQLKEATERADAIEKKSKLLERREQQLSSQEKDYQARKTALDELAKSQKQAPTADSALVKAKEALAKEQQDLATKRREVEQREQDVAKKEKQVSTRPSTGVSEPASAAGSADASLAELQRLEKELAAAKSQNASLDSSRAVTSFGRPALPPPVISRPPLRKPALKPPAQSLPKQFDRTLLVRFEAGRTALQTK